MAKQSLSAILRGILSKDLDLPSETVFEMLRSKGITGERRPLFKRIHSIRTELRNADGSPAPAPKAAPAKASAAKPAAAKAAAPQPVASVPAPVSTLTSGTPDLGHVLANVTRVNEVVTACGSSDTARQVADAVRSCGGVDQFMKHLELVTDIRNLTDAE